MNPPNYHIISVSSPNHPVMFEITLSDTTDDEDITSTLSGSTSELERRLGIVPEERQMYCLDVMTNNTFGKATHGNSLLGSDIEVLIERYCDKYSWDAATLQHSDTKEIEIEIVAQRRDENDAEYNAETEVCVTDPSEELSISRLLSARINCILQEWDEMFPN